MNSFKIIPILGRKTDVSQDDPSLFQGVTEGVYLTHDVGGVNFDLNRKRNSCTKSKGYTLWSNSATAQATKCLGLFELYDGTNRDHLFFDNGKVYVYDGSLDPADVTAAGVTHQTSDTDLVRPIKVGSYAVWPDRDDGTTPYIWKNGDANASKLISAGTEFKFRFLEYFSRRIIGCYSDQTNGDIDIRWSGSLPTPGSATEFVAANQLFAPNDDPITGIRKLGTDRCFIYSEDSIHQLAYYPDSLSIFGMVTVMPGQGSVNDTGIVSTGDAHYFFNKSYGFCQYLGGNQLIPISNDIEVDIQGINSAYYNLIVGTFVPLTRQIVWTVPLGGETTPDTLLFYNIDTKQWTKEDKAMRYVDNWQMYATMTWNDLITELGGTGAVWTAAGTRTWAYYISERQRLVYANTDGKLNYHASEGLAGSDIDGYRIEPILDFGDKNRKDLINEIWFDLSDVGAFNIDIYHRGGSTCGEVEAASWTSLGTFSCDSPEPPVFRTNLNDSYRLQQIKWGTDKVSEKFGVNGITFKINPGREF